MTDNRFELLKEQLVGRPIAWWRAPGRVNLIGDHTDYNQGFVLPMAIDRDCVVAIAPGGDRRITARSLELAGTVDIAADGSDVLERIEPRWGRFIAGVAQVLSERGVGLPALELGVASTVPVGSGLSSSSALSVALTLALAEFGHFQMDAHETARAALAAEVLATGVPGGLMDQLSALFGVANHALLIDCRSLEIDPIRIPSELSVVVVHSGVPRALAGTEYAKRRAACDAAARRLGVRTLRDVMPGHAIDDPYARHVITENARVLEFANALRDGEIGRLGPLLLASHTSLRDDFRVSTPELDILVEILVDAGALGARLTGAGFGGCVVAFTNIATNDVLGTAMHRYREVTRREPTAFVVEAVVGAGRIDP
jgi:galactokinase